MPGLSVASTCAEILEFDRRSHDAPDVLVDWYTGVHHGWLLVIEVRPNTGTPAVPGVACEARGAHSAVPAYKTRLVVLQPVRNVRRAAAQEFAAEHRQRAIDVAFTCNWEAFVGEARHGQIRPLAVVARQLGPATDGDRVEVLSLHQPLQRQIQAR